MNRYFVAFEEVADKVAFRTGQRPFIEHTGGGHNTVFLPLTPDDRSQDTTKPTMCMANYWWDEEDGALYTEVSLPALSVFPSTDEEGWCTDLYMCVDFDSPLYKSWEEWEEEFHKRIDFNGDHALNTDEMVKYVCHLWDVWKVFRDTAPEGAVTGVEVTP